MNINDFFYVGSCRYQGLFPKHFPPRLHSTKEMLFFLECMPNIENYLFEEKLSSIFGDIFHPIVRDKSIKFLKNKNNAFKEIKSFVIEISSRKYAQVDKNILSAYYYKNSQAIIAIDNKQLVSDLVRIRDTLREKFKINNLTIIPHLDLNFSDGTCIQERRDLKLSLRNACSDNDIGFIDISQAFGDKTFDFAFKDATHYTKEGSNTAFQFLLRNLHIDP